MTQTIDWTRPDWGREGTNVHYASNGSWVEDTKDEESTIPCAY